LEHPEELPEGLREALPETLIIQLRALTARYPLKRGALLPILHALQERRGHLAPADLRLAGGLTDVSPADVFSVATFYTMFRQRPAGRFPIGVCRNISCWVNGSEKIVAAIKQALAIGPGETTSDGIFSLSEVECLGSCGTAPCLEIDSRYFENVTPEQIRPLLARLKQSDGAPSTAILSAQADHATQRRGSA
jgi:NADH-quinone oxidoreductase E subunit